MRKATSLLLRTLGGREPTQSVDWWTYFGSFGNDIFDDDLTPAHVTTSDGGAYQHRGVMADTAVLDR